MNAAVASASDVTLEVRTQMNNPPRGATRDAKLPTLFFWRTANWELRKFSFHLHDDEKGEEKKKKKQTYLQESQSKEPGKRPKKKKEEREEESTF